MLEKAFAVDHQNGIDLDLNLTLADSQAVTSSSGATHHRFRAAPSSDINLPGSAQVPKPDSSSGQGSGDHGSSLFLPEQQAHIKPPEEGEDFQPLPISFDDELPPLPPEEGREGQIEPNGRENIPQDEAGEKHTQVNLFVSAAH